MLILINSLNFYLGRKYLERILEISKNIHGIIHREKFGLKRQSDLTTLTCIHLFHICI